MADPILASSYQVRTKLNKLTAKYQATLSRLAISPNEGWLFYITSRDVTVAFVCQYEVSPTKPIIPVDMLNGGIQYVFHIIADWEKSVSYLICHADKIEDRICDSLNTTDPALVSHTKNMKLTGKSFKNRYLDDQGAGTLRPSMNSQSRETDSLSSDSDMSLDHRSDDDMVYYPQPRIAIPRYLANSVEDNPRPNPRNWFKNACFTSY